MSLRYNKRHLAEMLHREGMSRDDQQALRLALWTMSDQEEPMPTGPPCWRNVRYTDDGCNLYQCLNCKNDWESRTEPGWMDTTERVDGPGEGIRSFMSGDEMFYYRDREEPVYRPNFNYCPFCGIEFEGPICSNVDNEYMRGENRVTRDAFVEQYHRENNWAQDEPKWWWVVQTRETWPDHETQDGWHSEFKMNADKVGAVRAYEHYQNEKSKCEGQTVGDKFGVRYEAHIIQVDNEDLKINYRHLYEVS